jgi:ferredoxin
MIRKIIKIDKAKCIGCGLCADACHEEAIAMVEGKATLLRDDYCDGLGNCLPHCPTGAISFENREAEAYDEEAVKKNMALKKPLPCGCPGSSAQTIKREIPRRQAAEKAETTPGELNQSELKQWPVQIRLVAMNAPYFENSNVLIAADCCAYAYGNFHREFMRDKITLIGCPKLDELDYSEKLTAIISQNRINSVTVARMQVPCCGGLENAALSALKNSGKMLPRQVITFSTDGRIL